MKRLGERLILFNVDCAISAPPFRSSRGDPSGHDSGAAQRSIRSAVKTVPNIIVEFARNVPQLLDSCVRDTILPKSLRCSRKLCQHARQKNLAVTANQYQACQEHGDLSGASHEN